VGNEKLGRIRVLYSVVAGVLCIVLLFVKKSQKTPSRELELAVRRLEEMTGELK
jgi:phage-related protein